MGVDPTRVKVTGTMKWDSAASGGVQGADALATALGIDRSKPLIVAGSTAPGEEAMLHAACPPGVQLLCAPRKPEWFAQAAAAMPACVRRSERREGRSDAPASGRFLLDTIGELRAAYSLADVVVIGRSFGVLHGSDMMEPAALGKPVVVGPRVGDFQSTADALLAGDAMVQVNAAGLADAIRALLADPARREQLAENARAVIAREQGATARNAAYIRAVLQDYSLRRGGRR
jgi:3-deoxy-D-manno-octulosonic-acid transferase